MSQSRTQLLSGCRVLVLEDEYFFADDLNRRLTEHGAEVVGPISELAEAYQLIVQNGFDAAIMNVNLRGQKAFVLADELKRRDIPFMFATGFGANSIPSRFSHVKVRQKPFGAQEIVSDVAELCSKGAR